MYTCNEGGVSEGDMSSNESEQNGTASQCHILKNYPVLLENY